MARIPTTLNFIGKTDRTWQMMKQIYEQVAMVINGKISLGIRPHPDVVGQTNPADNLDAVSCLYNINTPANTDFAITHNLGRIPTGYLVVAANANYGTVYNGVTSWTTTIIYLRFGNAYNDYANILVW